MKTKEAIKTVKEILLTDIDLRRETLSRQSLVKCLHGKPETWLAHIKESEPYFGEYAGLQELMASMKKTGQIECIGVKEIHVPKDLLQEDGREGVYWLVFGLRRFLAAYFLGWERIRAVILK